ncbi:MAG TPA: right-handed parallel beta-helix repeat-containing protein [Chthoniobacteraceae bacterium]|nr:right-handed parallel beta-helix repeat-containing protein [Chthoniobacteraceae bacterium]
MNPSPFSFRRSLFFLLIFAVLLILWKMPPVSPSEKEAPEAAATHEPARSDREGVVVHVAPGGDDGAEGSQEAPLATLARALERLGERGGTILLAGGVYTESFTVSGSGGPLLITAAPGQEVVFEGGQKLPSWKPHPDYPGVYITEIPDRQSLYDHTDYIDLWDQDRRIRYGKMADAAGVAHWPNSMVLLEGDTVLFHPGENRSPDELNLWVNRRAAGITLERGKVTLEGLTFRNYLGGSYARAVGISSGEGVTIRRCTFINCASGIRSRGVRLTVEESLFREVGGGVIQTNGGSDLHVRGCVLECAIGQFALSDVGEHTRNGIRVYHDADGAVVEECVTSGFWAGLYIKTISAKPGSRPYLIRNNTFLDGVRSGFEHRHPRTTITGNIIGTPSSTEAAGRKASYYVSMGAKVTGNLFFGEDAPETGDPFADLPAGDLTLRPDLDASVGALTRRKVSWSDRMARHLAPAAADSAPARLAGPPVVAASRLGAVISASFTRPVEPKLRYRVRGAGDWMNARGGESTIRLPRNMIAATPFEPYEPEAFSWSFAVSEVVAGRTYEFELDAIDAEGNALAGAKGIFAAQGEPKRLYVAAGADSARADGSERHPFADLQPALDRALPGDVVQLAPGFYSRPAVLHHGGREAAPLVIEGAGWEKTILDGGKRFGTLLELRNAPHVTLRGVQVRWFGNRGISVHDASGFRLERSWVWNQGFSGTGICGIGLWMENVPGSAVSYNLFNRLQNAVMAFSSPGLTFTHNTSFANLYSGLDLHNSSLGSVVTHNALTFTGNRSLHIREKDEAAFASLVCDYNNYANHLRKSSPKRPENDFTPARRYGMLVNQSKGIIAITMGRDVWRDFYTMADWRAFSSKDKHSLYADPEYVDPPAKDLRLLPGSPNLLADGTVIGALPVVNPQSAAAAPPRPGERNFLE